MPPALPRSTRYDYASVGRNNLAGLQQSIARDLPLLLLVSIYTVVVGNLVAGDAGRIAGDIPQTFLHFCLYALASVFVLQAGLCIFVTRPASPLRRLAGLAISALHEGQASRLLVFLLTLAALTATFGVFKPSISTGVDHFAWDPLLAEISRRMHFGRLPWERLQPFLGYPWITRILDLNYALWFGVMWVFAIGTAAFCRDEAHRQRALLSFALIWILAGSAMAAGFSSAGPCYYGKVVSGPDPFAALVTYLRSVHDSIGLIAVDAQGLLWADYAGGQPRIGISAMPSMHNAVAALVVLASWRYGFWLRAAVLTHAVLVFLGSILLGWHYAIDVYVAWGVTGAIWAATKPAADWWAARLEGGGRALPVPAYA